MIPGHLIDKAVRAAGEKWRLAFDWEHDKLHAQVHAALEAVAAEIWDQGYDTGWHDYLEDDVDDWAGNTTTPTPNPYEQETA